MTDDEVIEKLAEEAVNEMLYEYHHSVIQPVLDCSKIPPQMTQELMALVKKAFLIAAGKVH